MAYLELGRYYFFAIHQQLSLTMNMKFQPVSHSWVALHPQSKGVIQFIGGMFFGTFWPMLFYRSLLQRLFNDGYTIVLLPFNFTFDHYTEAGFLIREQYEIMPELVRRAISAGHDPKPYLSDQNFSWVGHSVGCKYIALLEALGGLPLDNLQELPRFIESILREAEEQKKSRKKGKNSQKREAKIPRRVQSIVTDLLILINDLEIKRKEAKRLIEYYIRKQANYKDAENCIEITSLFIKNQPSLLLAPVNVSIESAIPAPFGQLFVDLGLVSINPDPDETYALIKEGDLFNLMGLISFQKDKIALDTCRWFKDIFRKPPADFKKDLKGGHLKPLGIRLGNFVFNFPIPTFQPIQKRAARV